ncbi:MAG: hypothetical protein ACOZE7_21500 [Pseudomonadota bacterium]
MKAIRLIQIVFSLTGVALLCLALYLSIDTQRVVDAAIVGALGGVFLCVGGGMALYRGWKARLSMRLRAQGQVIQARIQGVEPNVAVSVNGQHPFVVLCQWQNPQTQEVHVFRSENLWFDPSDYLKRPQVLVFIEPENPRRYLVDLSFLPKLAA